MAIEAISKFDGLDLKESILVDSLENALSHRYTRNKPVLLRELDCWQGRADIVVACLDEDWYVPQEGGKLISRLGTAQVLSTLYPKRPRKIQDIVILTGLAETTVKRTIKELMICQIIFEKQLGSYILHPDMKLPKVEFHAFEAKLHNWKRALYQAINYFGFAQYSSVVMPDRYIGGALNNLRDFEINGIGLYSLSNEGLQTYLRPRKSRPRKAAFHLVGIGKVLLDIEKLNVGLSSKLVNR